MSVGGRLCAMLGIMVATARFVAVHARAALLDAANRDAHVVDGRREARELRRPGA